MSALVMTSCNFSDEPIAIDRADLSALLGSVCDYALDHDRRISHRCDDSIIAVVGDDTAVFRRSRGMTPTPVQVPAYGRAILAVGADTKNAFCIAVGGKAYLSQYIGEMSEPGVADFQEKEISAQIGLLGARVDVIAHDLHPEYHSTAFAERYPATERIGVQHHHAHLAACLADNGWRAEDGEVVGVMLDGTGYGSDDRIWGGEWLLGGYCGYRRLAHLEYLPLPGGDAATRHPWRIAAGYLYALFGEVPDGLLGADATPAALGVIRQQVHKSLNAPLSSSMGRLFDADSAPRVNAWTSTTDEFQISPDTIEGLSLIHI